MVLLLSHPRYFGPNETFLDERPWSVLKVLLVGVLRLVAATKCFQRHSKTHQEDAGQVPASKCWICAREFAPLPGSHVADELLGDQGAINKLSLRLSPCTCVMRPPDALTQEARPCRTWTESRHLAPGKRPGPHLTTAPAGLSLASALQAATETWMACAWCGQALTCLAFHSGLGASSR